MLRGCSLFDGAPCSVVRYGVIIDHLYRLLWVRYDGWSTDLRNILGVEHGAR